jgi:glycerol-3-phosphate acyltransferase PlsY
VILANVALVIGAYLLGSLPYMILLGRAKGIDLSQEEDLHIALWRKVGRLEGLSGVLVDILKGAIPVLIGFIFHFHLAVIALAGVAAVAGQMWSVFQKFDAERGNTAGLGMILTLTVGVAVTESPRAYWILLFALIPPITGFLIRTIPRFMAPGQTLSERFMFGGPVSNGLPLGVAVGLFLAPPSSWCLRQPLEMTLGLVGLLVIIMLRRLTVGLRADLKTATNVRSILINRLLYDRSYLQPQ